MEEAEPTLRDVLGAVVTLSGAVAAVDTKVDAGFEQVDRRFEVVDGRLDAMDRRLEATDELLQVQDAHFGRVETRLGRLEPWIDVLGTKLDRHMERIHAEIAAVKAGTCVIEQRLDDVYAAVSRHMTDPDAHRRPDEN